MIKNYILAFILSSSASVSFCQNRTFSMFPGTAVVDGIRDSRYHYMEDISNCINIGNNECGLAEGGTYCVNKAKWSAMYDSDAMYVIVEVIDATAGGVGDGVDVYLSLDNNRNTNCPDNWPRAYSVNTFHIQFQSPEQLEISSPTKRASAVGEAKSVINADGYTLEFSLLYSQMDSLSVLFLGPGSIIGFDIGVNQNAYKGSLSRIAQSMWNASGADRNWTESNNFGIIHFLLCGAVNSLNSLISNVAIAPNPAANQVSVVINAKQQDEVAIAIINTLSQKVYVSKQTLVAGATKHEISTSDMPNGIYTVFISKGNLSTTEKLIINR